MYLIFESSIIFIFLSNFILFQFWYPFSFLTLSSNVWLSLAFYYFKMRNINLLLFKNSMNGQGLSTGKLHGWVIVLTLLVFEDLQTSVSNVLLQGCLFPPRIIHQFSVWVVQTLSETRRVGRVYSGLTVQCIHYHSHCPKDGTHFFSVVVPELISLQLVSFSFFKL